MGNWLAFIYIFKGLGPNTSQKEIGDLSKPKEKTKYCPGAERGEVGWRGKQKVMVFHLSSLISQMPKGSLPGPVCLDGLAIRLAISMAAEKLRKVKRTVGEYTENSR